MIALSALCTAYQLSLVVGSDSTTHHTSVLRQDKLIVRRADDDFLIDAGFIVARIETIVGW